MHTKEIEELEGIIKNHDLVLLDTCMLSPKHRKDLSYLKYFKYQIDYRENLKNILLENDNCCITKEVFREAMEGSKKGREKGDEMMIKLIKKNENMLKVLKKNNRYFTLTEEEKFTKRILSKSLKGFKEEYNLPEKEFRLILYGLTSALLRRIDVGILTRDCGLLKAIPGTKKYVERVYKTQLNINSYFGTEKIN